MFESMSSLGLLCCWMVNGQCVTVAIHKTYMVRSNGVGINKGGIKYWPVRSLLFSSNMGW